MIRLLNIMATQPLVNVIIPSFNRAELSLKAIRSVSAQSYSNMKIILVNDGSSEDYSEVESLVSELGGDYVKTSNSGVAAARNLGIELSQGEYIAFLDSDDEWMEEKLFKQVDFLEHNRQYFLVQAFEKWNRNGKFLKVPKHLQPAHGDSFEKAIEHCCIGPSSVLIRKELFSEIGNFDTNLRICEDYDLWLRILDRYPVFCIQEELSIKYGGHADQLSMSEEAIDRYRVYALFKYLCGATDTDKIKLVKSSLLKRLNILLSGAKKRNLITEVSNYLHLLEIIETNPPPPPSNLPTFLLI